MKKVHISLYAKNGDSLVSAIGFIDETSKTLYIPKMSKKNVHYIDAVVYDHYECGIATCYVYIEDRCFANNYYIHELDVVKTSK